MSRLPAPAATRSNELPPCLQARPETAPFRLSCASGPRSGHTRDCAIACKCLKEKGCGLVLSVSCLMPWTESNRRYGLEKVPKKGVLGAELYLPGIAR